MQKGDELSPAFVDNTRKPKIPSHLTIKIKIPLRKESGKLDENKVFNILKKANKKNKKKHRNLASQNIKMPIPIPIKEEIEHNSFLLGDTHEMNELKESLSDCCLDRFNPENAETYSCFVNGLNNSEMSEQRDIKIDNTSLLDRHENNSKENINLAKEETTIANHETHNGDFYDSKSHINLHSSLDRSSQESDNGEIFRNGSAKRYKSMSMVYSNSNDQYTTPEKTKCNTHLSELPDGVSFNVDTKEDLSDYSITSSVGKVKNEHTLNFEGDYKKQRAKHKSKRKRIEIGDSEINDLSIVRHKTHNDDFSHSTPQINMCSSLNMSIPEANSGGISENILSNHKSMSMVYSNDNYRYTTPEKTHLRELLNCESINADNEKEGRKEGKLKNRHTLNFDSDYKIDKEKVKNKCEKNNVQIDDKDEGRHDAHKQDFCYSKLQINKPTDMFIQEASNQEVSKNISDCHYNSRSIGYSDSSDQYTTLKERKRKRHLNELSHCESISVARKEEASDHSITSLVEAEHKKDKKRPKHKSKKNKIEVYDSGDTPNVASPTEKNKITGESCDKETSSQKFRKEECSTVNMTENDALKKCVVNKEKLLETNNLVDSQLESKNKVNSKKIKTDIKEVVNEIVNDSFPSESTLEKEGKSLNVEETIQVSKNIESKPMKKKETHKEKEIIQVSKNIKSKPTKKKETCKEKENNNVEKVNKRDKVTCKRERKARISKPKLNLAKKYESSEDEANNLDSVLDFVKDYVKKTSNFKMNDIKLKGVKNNSCSNTNNKTKSSNLNKLLADSSDGFTSDDSLGDFTRQFNKDHHNKIKDQDESSNRKDQTDGTFKEMKQSNLTNYITVSKEVKETGVPHKSRDKATLIEPESDINEKHSQDYRIRLNNFNTCNKEKSNPASGVMDVTAHTDSKRNIPTNEKKNIIIETNTKTFESKLNKVDENSCQILQNKSKISNDTKLSNVDLMQKKKIKTIKQIKKYDVQEDVHLENYKIPVEKHTEQEILAKENNSSSKDTDDGHKKRIHTNKLIKERKLEEEIHLGDKKTIEAIYKKNISLSDSSVSNDESENDKLENKQHSKKVKKLVKKISKNRSKSPSKDTSDESGSEFAPIELIEEDKSHEDTHSTQVKTQCKKKSRKKTLTKDSGGEFRKKTVTKEIILSYFDKILQERYQDTTKKYKSSAFVQSDGSSSDINADMRGVSDFKTDMESDSDTETKIKMQEIIARAEDDLLHIQEENEALASLKIYPDWDVHISHTIETRISSCPTADQRQLFEEFNINIKVGPFTRIEDDMIKENFKRFCTVHGLQHNPVPFLNFKYGTRNLLSKPQRINFARYIGKGLENRMLFCIYQRFKTIYSSVNKGRFTAEEDAIILHYMKKINGTDKNHFSSLSKILGRPRISVEKRYRMLRSNSASLNADYTSKFVQCLMEVTLVETLAELRDREITTEEWHSVSKILNIDYRKLKLFWMASLYTKLFHAGPIPVDAIMKKLVLMLDESKEDDYRHLNWSKLAQSFKYVTREFLYRLFKKTRNCVVPSEMHGDLRQCILYLKDKYAEGKAIMEDIPNIMLNL